MTIGTRCPSCGERSDVDPYCPHPSNPDAPHLLHHAATCTAGQREHFLLHCGCQGWKEGPSVAGTFVYRPCGDEECTYYRYILAESARQAKPVDRRSP